MLTFLGCRPTCEARHQAAKKKESHFMNIKRSICVSACLMVSLLGVLSSASEDKPLTPVEARKQVGNKVEVQMKPAVIKDRLEKRGEIYMDSEKDFRDEKNFAVVITEKGANRFKEKGIKDPAKHFEDKEIRAKGTVTEVQGVPRIEVDDPDQISIVEKKPSSSMEQEWSTR
jgi:DNA/RNA endonuclease YhcR with UshA esterase domain